MLVGLLAGAVLVAQGVLVYVAVDQVDRTDLAEIATRLAPHLGSESGPPLRLDATPTPTATAPVPGVDSSVRVAEQPANPVPGQVELILADGPPGPPGPPSAGPPDGAAGADVGTRVQRPRPQARVPSADEPDADAPTTRFPAFPTRLSNPDRDGSNDQREDLESSEPSRSPPPRGGEEDGARADERRGPNTCDDERVDHHDDGDDHGVDCETPERDRARTSPGGTAEEAPPARARNDRRTQPQSADEDRRGHRDHGEADDADAQDVAADRRSDDPPRDDRGNDEDRSHDDRRGGSSSGGRDDDRSGERSGRAGGPKED